MPSRRRTVRLYDGKKSVDATEGDYLFVPEGGIGEDGLLSSYAQTLRHLGEVGTSAG
jgi:hypothetical protein